MIDPTWRSDGGILLRSTLLKWTEFPKMKTKSNKDRTYVPCVESLHSCTEIRTHWTSTQDCSDLNQSRQRTFSLTQWLHFEMFCFLPLARCVFVLFPQNSNSRLRTRVTARLRTELENPPNAASLSRVADGMGGVWSEQPNGTIAWRTTYYCSDKVFQTVLLNE